MEPQEIIGKRLIVIIKRKIREASIIEVSPSGEYVKLKFTSGTQVWKEKSTLLIVDIFNPTES